MNHPDSSIDEYRNTITPEGCSLYYALLYYPEHLQSALIILHAFYAEIRHIKNSCSDPGIARIKLQWWREELQYCTQHNSRHRLTKLLSAIIEQHQIDINGLYRIIDATENQIHPHYQFESERLRDLQHGIADIWRLGSQLTSRKNDDQLNAVTDCASTIQSIQQTIMFYEDLAKGRCYFAEERLHNQQLDLQTLSTMDPVNLWHTLLQPSYRELEQQLQIQYKTLTQTKPFLFGCVLSRIYLAMLKKVLKSSKPMNPDSMEIIPIQKLWYAWRCYKQFGSE